MTPGTISSDLHGEPACQAARQFEQKSILHVGQWTHWGVQRSFEHSVHIVSQPARGHHVRLLSISTSVNIIKRVNYQTSLVYFFVLAIECVNILVLTAEWTNFMENFLFLTLILYLHYNFKNSIKKLSKPDLIMNK